MSDLMNIANPSALTDSLNKAMRRSRRDPRVATWMKKKARSWLLRRDDNGTRIGRDDVNGFQILPGSGLDEDLPDWARKARDEGRPLHYFTMSASADAMLRHIDDFFADLLDYEAEAQGARSEMAKRFLDHLNHRDVKDAHDQAEQFYIDLSESAPKAASRSRNDIFAVPHDDDSAPVEYKVSGNRAWRQVTPRGLKTVAVVLSNCLGGAHYAVEVKTGRSEIWCLVNDVPESEFDRDRDILGAAKIRCKDRILVEFNGPQNRAAIDHLDAMEEFSEAYTFDAADEIRRNARGTLTKDHFKRNHDTYAERNGVAFVVERMGSGIDKLMKEGVRRHDFGLAHEVSGRMKIDRLGSICIGTDKKAVIEMDQNPTHKALADSTHESALVEGLEKMLADAQVIGVTVPTRSWFADQDRERAIVGAFEQTNGPVRSEYADLLFDEDFNLRPWTRDIVFSDNTEDAILRVSSTGLTHLYDLNTEKSLVTPGSPRICKAAREAAAQSTPSSRPVSRQVWKNILKSVSTTPETSKNKFARIRSEEMTGWGSLNKNMFAELCRLDHSKDLVTPSLSLNQDSYGEREHELRFELPHVRPHASTTHILKDMRDLYTAGTSIHAFDTGQGFRIEKSPIVGGWLYQAVDGDDRVDLVALTNAGYPTFARVQNSFLERLSIADLRMLSDELASNGAQISTEAGRNPFIAELFRTDIGTPVDLTNLGSDERPILKLEKPKRLVGIIPGADGTIENGYPAWILMPKARGEVVLRHITPNGMEHLRRSAQDKGWSISFSPEGTAQGEIQDAGWNVARGILLKLSNRQIEDLESEHFTVRRQHVIGPEDRQFDLMARPNPDDPYPRDIPVLHFGADPQAAPGTPHLAMSGPIAAENFPEAMNLVAAAFNEMKIMPTTAQRQFYGFIEDEHGKLQHDGRDPKERYAVADGYFLHRNLTAFAEDNFSNTVQRESWWLTKEGSFDTVAHYQIKTGDLTLTTKATPEVLRAAAEMLEIIQQDRIFERPLEPAPAPHIA